MLSLELSDFLVQLKEGSIRNVGAPTKSATIKLFDVSSAGARPFGDNRIKCVFADDEGNEIEIALFPAELEELVGDLEEIKAAGTIAEFGDDG